MRQSPTHVEKLKNAAMFLCLAERLSRRGVIGDGLKVQKCTFLVTLDQFHRNLKGFNLTFFRYRWGPYSKQLWELRDWLRDSGLLEERTRSQTETGGDLALTEAGKSLAAELCAEVWSDDQNAEFVRTIENVARDFGNKDTKAVIDHVYEMEVQPLVGAKQRIKDIANGVDITRVLDPAEAVAEIAIPESWLDTLAIALSRGNSEGIRRSADDLAQGRVRSHEEVWA